MSTYAGTAIHSRVFSRNHIVSTVNILKRRYFTLQTDSKKTTMTAILDLWSRNALREV